jgi:hypothetical protein
MATSSTSTPSFRKPSRPEEATALTEDLHWLGALATAKKPIGDQHEQQDSLNYWREPGSRPQHGTGKLTLSGCKRPYPVFLGGYGCGRPRSVRIDAKLAVGLPGNQMLLKIEGIVDGAMRDEESLG